MTDEHMPGYKRHYERHEVEQVVDVYDSERDVYLGRLVNIHTHGLMIIGDMVCEEDHLYKLDLQLFLPVNGRSKIRIGVDCMWTRSAEDNTKVWSGFSIIDMAIEAEADIGVIMETFG